MLQTQTLWHHEHIHCPIKFNGEEMGLYKHDLRIYKKGESVFIPDDLSDRIFFIHEGRIKISVKNDDGREIIKDILGRGEVFGEMALLGESRRHDFALALEKTSIYIILLDELRRLILTESEVNIFFMRVFAVRQLAMERRLESLVFRDSRSRIVEFLVNLVKKRGRRVGSEWVVRPFITHMEIANQTATSRQTVTTTLNDLRHQKLVRFNRKQLLVRDLNKLQKEEKSQLHDRSAEYLQQVKPLF